MDDGFQEFDVLEEVAHPFWDGNIPLYDVMLIKLSGQSTQPLLTVNNDPNLPATEGDFLTLMGFDFDILGEIASNTILQEVDVGYIPNDVCSELEDPSIGISLDGLVTEQWLCADEDDRGICFGDAGNPLILPGADNTQDVQVGLAAA
jgi:secreted trypsin-like serine protease